MDLAGPFSVKTPEGVRKMLLVTAIDPTKEINDASSNTVSAAMDCMWFCRHPHPHFASVDGSS